MTKIDLRKSSGFPIHFENETLMASGLQFQQIQRIGLDDIRKQLLNNEVTCPETFYDKYTCLDQDGIYKSKNLEINFYVIMPNLAGIEFVKTRANMVESYPRLIEVVYGGGVLMMQDFGQKFEGDIYYTNLKKGQKAIVLPNFEMCLANTKATPLIIAEYSFSGIKIHDSLDDMRGMSYYVIRKNAKQEIVRNPEYRLANTPKKISWDKTLTQKGITSKTPLIKQILRKYEKFTWLFSSDPITI